LKILSWQEHSESTADWGIGPSIVLPTRTYPALGSDQLGLGPTAASYAKDA
jgi:hypothetical protein